MRPGRLPLARRRRAGHKAQAAAEAQGWAQHSTGSLLVCITTSIFTVSRVTLNSKYSVYFPPKVCIVHSCGAARLGAARRRGGECTRIRFGLFSLISRAYPFRVFSPLLSSALHSFAPSPSLSSLLSHSADYIRVYDGNACLRRHHYRCVSASRDASVIAVIVRCVLSCSLLSSVLMCSPLLCSDVLSRYFMSYTVHEIFSNT